MPEWGESAGLVGAGVAAGWCLASQCRRRAAADPWKPLAGKTGGAHAEMLTNAEHTRLLKPLDQGARSMREVEAYEQLQRTPLAPFLAGMYGVTELSDPRYVDGWADNTFKGKFMEIDNAYAGIPGPHATLDIKIGRKTWEDAASAEKIAKESKKFAQVYAQSSAKDGYRVVGMRAGGLILKADLNLKKRHSCLPEEFRQWILPAFFADAPGYGALPEGMAGTCSPPSNGCAVDMRAAKEVLQQLRVLGAAAELGYGGSIRAASVLLIREMRQGGKWSVRLIDLAHYTPDSERRDDNFCDGLKGLIGTWQEFVAG